MAKPGNPGYGGNLKLATLQKFLQVEILRQDSQMFCCSVLLESLKSKLASRAYAFFDNFVYI